MDECLQERTRGTVPDTTGVDGRLSRREVLAAGGAATTLSVAGCLGTIGGQEGTDSGMPSVSYRHNFRRVAMSVSINDAGEELGLWEEEGVDVDFKTSTGAKKAAKSVASGADDFGNGDYGTVARMINAGEPLRIIGHIHFPMDGVVALEDAGIDSFSDLEGKVVGQYDPEKPRVKEAIRRDGGDPSKVEWKTTHPGSAEKLLVNDEVDAMAAYWSPVKVWLEQNGYEATALNTADKLDYMGLALYGHRDVVENKPDVVNSFVRGVMRAHKVAATDTEKVENVYRKKVDEFNEELEYAGFGYHLASRVPSPEKGKSEGFGWLEKERLRHTLDLYTDIGIIDEAKPVGEYLDLGWFGDNNDLAVETAEAIYDKLEADYPFGPTIIN